LAYVRVKTFSCVMRQILGILLICFVFNATSESLASLLAKQTEAAIVLKKERETEERVTAINSAKHTVLTAMQDAATRGEYSCIVAAPSDAVISDIRRWLETEQVKYSFRSRTEWMLNWFWH
jgi:hypothetical protein